MTRDYNFPNIRALLNEGFSEQELRRLCFDESAFRPVYDQLAEADGKVEIIQQLIEYADRKVLLEKLLALARQNNPHRYSEHQPYYSPAIERPPQLSPLQNSDETRPYHRPPTSLVGQHLGKYYLIAQVGRGGMAEVYKSYDPGLSIPVAIKVIHNRLAESEDLVERFHSEAMAVASLRHDGIVRVMGYDYSDELDLYYIVMEFIEGPTLGAKLKAGKDKNQSLPWAEIGRIFDELADALDYAHTRGIIHRDLKPSNIMFTAGEQVVLTDFGIARLAGAHFTGTGQHVGGTPIYMSPEQGENKPVDRRSDIYSLGVLLYEITTGKVPFDADTPVAIVLKHIKEPVPRPTLFNPQLPQPVERVILRALRKKPDDRFQTAGEMAWALQAAINEAGGSTLLSPLSTIPFKDVSPPLPGTSDDTDSCKTSPRRYNAPFQAPPDTPHFVGRESEIARFREMLNQAKEQNIYCLTGMGGLGKTTLAVHLAHALRDHFQDGVLWANMATSEPLTVLDSWGRAYDFDFSTLRDLDSRAAALRGELANKKILFILDDVRAADQVRPLLPSSPDSAVLITTRDLELAAALDAQIFAVPVLTPMESRGLLAHIAGQKRVLDEEAFAGQICQLLGHLPLAVEIAAQRLASRQRWHLADLVGRLRDEKHRLEELKISDKEVRASFSISWAALDDDLRRTFALLAVFEGRAFSIPALAAVAEVDQHVAEDRLYHLVALSLVAEEGQIYYRLHPLLADFAFEKLGLDEAVYARMTRYFLSYVITFQYNYSTLEQEWENIIAGMKIAFEQHHWQDVLAYARGLEGAWFTRARFADARQGYQWAAEAAEVLKDFPALAVNLRQWGRACIEQSDYPEAEKFLTRSLHLMEVLNDQPGIADIQYCLGRIAIEKSNFDEAQILLEKSRQIRERLGDKGGVAQILNIQFDIPYYQGDYAEAGSLSRQALEIQQSIGDKTGSIRSLGMLTATAIKQNDLAAAENYCQQALILCEETKDQGELAVILYNFSEVCRLQGHLASARTHAERSLTLLTHMGDQKMRANALWRLSLIDADLKDYEFARQESEQSLNILQSIGDTWGVVYNLLQLGDISRALNQPERAYEYWSEGLELVEAIPQHPLAEILQERLNTDPIET